MSDTINDFKVEHFKEVFGDRWESVYESSPVLKENEEMFIHVVNGKETGWVHFSRHTYCLKFRGFAVHPDYRGQGVAKILMDALKEEAIRYHKELVSSGKKPNDIKLMYLKSPVYFDADEDGEAFVFGKYLKRVGFSSHIYNNLELDNEEVAAIEAYRELYSEHVDKLRVFKLAVVDEGVELSDESKEELSKLDGKILQVVMDGLDV